MPKNKNTVKELEGIEGHDEVQLEEVIEQPKRKKEHTVVLIGKTRVVYFVSQKLGNSTTPLLDVWKGKLKVGDTIYLEE
jgi:hypothetical protein